MVDVRDKYKFKDMKKKNVAEPTDDQLNALDGAAHRVCVCTLIIMLLIIVYVCVH